jgi:hypothetical protein
MFILFFVFLASLITTAQSRCDNSCSGHGTCDIRSLCTCYDNWGLGLSHDSGDCSQRICPYEFAWVDTPDKYGRHHKYAECAAKGITLENCRFNKSIRVQILFGNIITNHDVLKILNFVRFFNLEISIIPFNNFLHKVFAIVTLANVNASPDMKEKLALELLALMTVPVMENAPILKVKAANVRCVFRCS